MAQETTWTEMLDEPPSVEIRPVREGRKNLRAGQLMLYPNGRAVDAAIRAIPKGAAMSLKELRAALAAEHAAEITCPVTTAKCLRTVVEAAYEAFSSGTPAEEVTPVWRVLDAKAATLKKISFDPTFILEQRTREAL